MDTRLLIDKLMCDARKEKEGIEKKFLSDCKKWIGPIFDILYDNKVYLDYEKVNKNIRIGGFQICVPLKYLTTEDTEIRGEIRSEIIDPLIMEYFGATLSYLNGNNEHFEVCLYYGDMLEELGPDPLEVEIIGRILIILNDWKKEEENMLDEFKKKEINTNT